MSLLLDTNVVSELRKVRNGKAHPAVSAWLTLVDHETMFISVFTLFEIEYGIRLLERRDRRQALLLHRWLEESVIPAFAGNTLPIETSISRQAAQLRALQPRQVPDTFLAATALVHRMTVVTRNVRDFDSMGVRVLNPWGE